MALYNLLLCGGGLLFSPVVLTWLLLSEKRRKTVARRLWLKPERAGDTGPPSTARPVWVHALSVGEVLSAEALVSKLPDRFPDRPVVVTAATRTGYEIARKRLAGRISRLHYFPHDLRFSVRRATSAIDPALVVLVETDLWPNFLDHMHRRNVPVVLANTRLSEKSFAGYRRFSFFTAPLFSSLAAICVQSAEDARRFQALGVPPEKIHTIGNLKFDSAAVSPETGAMAGLRKHLDTRNEKVLLAGSTHPGEEALVLSAFRRLKIRHPALRLVIAPRDPRRAGDILRMARAAGGTPALFPAEGWAELPRGADTLVVAEMGLLARIYGLADIALVGGSLVPCGGHNPLEAAAWGKPVLFGRDMSDFREIARQLVDAGGALRLEDGEALAEAADTLLADPAKSAEMGRRALEMVRQNAGATERTLTILERYLR